MFSEPPVSWETPLRDRGSYQQGEHDRQQPSAMLLVSLLETPSLPSCGAAK